MKVFQLTTHAAGIWLGIICTLTAMHSAHAGYTMDETCIYVNEGYIADPSNCQNWGYCKGGVLYANGVCPNGYLYDSENGECNYANSVTCHTTTEDICQNINDAGFVGNPNNCNEYCYCVTGSIIECHNCPPNQVFDPDQSQCVWSSQYTCPANSVCQLVQNNQFVGDPDNCNNFIRCVGSTGQSAPCQPGLYYNRRTGKCQSTPACSGSNSNGPTPNTPAPDTAICSTYTGPDTEYMPDTGNCGGFFSCSNAAGPGGYGLCLFGTHLEGQKCVTPYEAKCTADRCTNLNLPMVTVPNTGCKQYAICKNGVQVPASENSCSNVNPAYQYFDEVLQACVTSPPTFAICS